MGFLNGEQFEVSDDTCRGCFLKEVDSKELGLYLEPVYTDQYISIRQDAECALPGFYIVSLNQHIGSLMGIEDIILCRLWMAIKNGKNLIRMSVWNKKRRRFIKKRGWKILIIMFGFCLFGVIIFQDMEKLQRFMIEMWLIIWGAISFRIIIKKYWIAIRKWKNIYNL